MSLPKGFKRLEYIQSSGTQYIDTGFAPNHDTRVVADFQFLAATTSFQSVFGSRTSIGGADRFCFYLSGSSYFRSDYGNTNQNFPNTISTTGRHTVDKNKNVTLIDGTNSVTHTATSFTSALNLTIFANNTNGKTGEFGSEMLYSCQIYDSGTLVRDFIPCQNASGSVGLWDAESEVFYGNAGTGTFTAGPVVPEIVDESEITELEYIQSSGTQYVDTGYVWTNESVKTEIGFEYLAVGNNTLFGTYKAATAEFGICPWVESGTTNVKFFAGTSTNLMATPIAVNTPYELVCVTNNKTLSIDLNGIQKSSAYSGTIQTGQTVALFADNMTAGVSQYSKMKLRYFRMYDNGTLVRDFVPCQNASGAVGLWDSVNERFYASSTTTDLIAGPEVQTVPKSPANFRVESATDTLVTLTWDESDKAVGYRLYKSGQLLADTTETSISVTVEPFADAVFTLTAYNENGEGAGAELTYFNAPDDPILFLVTDRTQQDVALGNTKGTYNASDLNRVGYAVAYLADKLASCGVKTTVHPKTDWVTTDIPSEQVMVTYLQNVRTLRTALTLATSVPEVPQDMQFFTHTEANDIEMLLVMLDAHITNMLSIVDTSWAVGSTYTGFYAKEAYR